MTTRQIAPNGEDTWEQRVAQEAEEFLGDSFTTNQLLLEQEGGVLPTSFLHEGEDITRPSQELPVGLRVTDLNFKGYRKVWDTKTGAMSLQPRWLLWQTARKHHDDGTPMFTLKDPKIPQDHGEDLFCPLNPKAPESERFSGMGFKPCKKQHIPHEAGRMSHVQHSHKRAWEAMKQRREDNLRQEDRALQLRVIEAQEKVANAMLTNMGGAATPAAPKATRRRRTTK